jgi:hypothetical protein
VERSLQLDTPNARHNAPGFFACSRVRGLGDIGPTARPHFT